MLIMGGSVYLFSTIAIRNEAQQIMRYIAENDRTTRADGIDWAEVEREAYRLTGNSGMLLPQTKGGKTNPSGRITIVDEKANGGKPFGVAGVKVMCNAFVKFCSDYTDRDGYYELSRGFRL